MYRTTSGLPGQNCIIDGTTVNPAAAALAGSSIMNPVLRGIVTPPPVAATASVTSPSGIITSQALHQALYLNEACGLSSNAVHYGVRIGFGWTWYFEKFSNDF